MREKNFGKLFLTWLLAATMVLTLLPVSMLAMDAPGEAEDGEVVLAPVAGVEEEEAAPVEATPMLLATPAAADTPIAVPTDKLFFDKANGVITGIDADWLAENKDKPLSVTIPAEIGGVAVTSIGQNAFNGKKVVAVDFSNATNLEKIDNQAFMHSPVASVDLSNTQVTVIGKFAFGDCKSLETFIFSNTLTSLGNSDGASVFTDCRSLKVMRLAGSPEGVVFELPEGLTTIGYQCFKNCFADGVDAKVIIPASVATLGEGAFYDEHITQIIFEKTVDPWKNEDYSGYANSAITPPSDCDRIIVLPDNKCFAAYSTQVGYGSKLQKICTYPIKITFSPLGKQEQHLNHALLGWTYNPATKLWDFNNNYKLPDTNGATSGNERPGYEYVGGWKLRSSYQVLNENEKLEAKDNPSDRATVSGEYKLANPTISYLVDGKTENVDANQPFTVTIGDSKEHSIGIQVDHPLLKENQGTDEDYVYFEYYWFDEVSLGDGKNTLNGPRSTEEQKRFSAATSNVKIQYVDGKHNTIPIAKTEHARYEGSSYEGYNDYYLVVVFGYHVVNGKKADTPFYLSANNGIGVGNANATHGPHLLQVKVDEVRVITATADEHGKIAPAAGTITVPKGKSETFTITPDSGYRIKDVLVDGKSVGAVSTYTFENVVDNHTIHATFARKHTPTPSTPTVEIPDDDALGLNTTDHFAYIVGYGNGEVRPQNNITRAEVATIFFRLLTDDVRAENLTKTNRYSDVAATSWYNTAVSTLSSMGIITGYPDGTFRPNAAITRAEFAAIAARFDNDGDKTAAKFSDIATHWAKDEISIAYNNGWITGYPDGTFGPQRDITRAETMTLVNRVLNRQPETEDDLLPNMTVWTDNANPKAWYYLAVQEATNSHYYEFKTNSQYEKWTELRETRDWKALEQ
ncbi:MAG: S-layer homology domain-containing protein [Oscillospiraceae bacterium]|nr:S-layer homology domain-containing protein [Oscillospiraceae bacterium]